MVDKINVIIAGDLHETIKLLNENQPKHINQKIKKLKGFKEKFHDISRFNRYPLTGKKSNDNPRNRRNPRVLSTLEGHLPKKNTFFAPDTARLIQV